MSPTTWHGPVAAVITSQTLHLTAEASAEHPPGALVQDINSTPSASHMQDLLPPKRFVSSSLLLWFPLLCAVQTIHSSLTHARRGFWSRAKDVPSMQRCAAATNWTDEMVATTVKSRQPRAGSFKSAHHPNRPSNRGVQQPSHVLDPVAMHAVWGWRETGQPLASGSDQ